MRIQGDREGEREGDREGDREGGWEAEGEVRRDQGLSPEVGILYCIKERQ